MKSKVLFFVAWLSIVLGILITCWYLVNLYKSGWSFWSDSEINMEKSGVLGDYIGGFVGTMVSIGGFIFLYVTLKDQRDNFHSSKIETRVYEMIKIHRDNVSEMEYTYYDIPESKVFDIKKEDVEKRRCTAKARKVFKLINNDFELLYNELDFKFNHCELEDIYEPGYLKNLTKNTSLLNREINLIEYAKIDITYLIIFFGLSASGLASVKNFFKDRYKKTFTDDLLFLAKLKPKRESDYFHKWFNFNRFEGNESTTKAMVFQGFKVKHFNLEEELTALVDTFSYNNNYIKYYGGHQFRLGHYFRHLYQTVTFIHKENKISNDDKYKFVKLLRGQLSTYEQNVFFYNSISILGRIWELEDFHNNSMSLPANAQLVTNYNLIKNIPADNLFDNISTSNYYPLVTFESRNNMDIKIKRKLIFNKKGFMFKT